MSRYFATATNGRGNTVSIGGRGNAGAIHLRGWDVGVKVVPSDRNGKDAFDVYLTHGSHATGSDKLLGTVTLPDDPKDGPIFVQGPTNVHSGKIFLFDGGE